MTLFSLTELAPLAIIHDSLIQKYGSARRPRLASGNCRREDATVAGLFGSGWQAPRT